MWPGKQVVELNTGGKIFKVDCIFIFKQQSDLLKLIICFKLNYSCSGYKLNENQKNLVKLVLPMLNLFSFIPNFLELFCDKNSFYPHFENYCFRKILLTNWLRNLGMVVINIERSHLCNLRFHVLLDLLRRLSKSQNTVFCGRIQLFLARLFPLSEKSGKLLYIKCFAGKSLPDQNLL